MFKTGDLVQVAGDHNMTKKNCNHQWVLGNHGHEIRIDKWWALVICMKCFSLKKIVPYDLKK